MSVSVIILAAGESKRMHSEVSKLLHKVAGLSLLERIVQTTQFLEVDKTYVVYGKQHPEVKEAIKNNQVIWVEQPIPLGSGHAVMQVLNYLSDAEQVLILCGDVPLISVNTLKQLMTNVERDEIGLLTAEVKNPFGLGRIIRNSQGEFARIVEEKDATESERAICEINGGIYIIPAKWLKRWIPQLKNQNRQKEYYLPDILPLAREAGVQIKTVLPHSVVEILGVNDAAQLAEVERIYQQQQAREYMKQGLHLMDPNRFDLRGNLKFGQDVSIDIDVIIEGNVTLGARCKIGPYVILKNVAIGDDVTIHAHSVIEDSVIESRCSVGPFARLRPGNRLLSESQVGNFIEIKKSTIGHRTKAHHVGYLGDATIGDDVNIGAGTITCNYNGACKNPTIIKDRAFIGSLSALVAPVEIGEGATIGAGSTITKNAPADYLTLARAQQVTIKEWKRPIALTKKRG